MAPTPTANGTADITGMSAEPPMSSDGKPVDPSAPVVNVTVAGNAQGTHDVVMTAGGEDGLRLASAIEDAFQASLNEHIASDKFSGHIQIVVLPKTPAAARKHLTAMLERLRGVCSDLSKDQKGRYRVSLSYQKDPAQATTERPAVLDAREKADAARLAAAIATGRPPRASSPSPYWKLLPVLPAVIGAISIYLMTRPPVSFPESVTLGESELARAGTGHRDDGSAAVYVPAGERMPSASLQLGVFVSTAHPSADDLLAWMQQQFRRSDSAGFYDVITGTERCLVGINPEIPRHFVALQWCDDRGGKAVCAESDLLTPRADIDDCEDDEACLAALCDARWAEERAPLEAVVNRFLR